MADYQKKSWDLLKKVWWDALNLVNGVLPNNPVNKLNQTYNALKRDTAPLMDKVRGLTNEINWYEPDESRFIWFNNPAKILQTGQVMNQQPQVNQNKFTQVYNDLLRNTPETTNSFPSKVNTAFQRNSFQEELLNYFQKAFYDTNWGLTEDMVNQIISENNIRQLNPNFNAKDIISLQSEITPILRETGEYIDNKQIAEHYPNLFDYVDTEALKEKYKKQDENFYNIVNQVKKANYNALTDDGKLYYNSINNFVELAKQAREQFGISDNITDSEIISTIMSWDDVWQMRANKMKKALKNLSIQDKKQLFSNDNKLINFFEGLITGMYWVPFLSTTFNQNLWQLNNAWQENVQPFIERWRQENPGTVDLIWRWTNAVADIASIPGNALRWLERISSNTLQLTDFDPNKELNKQVSEKLENVVKMSWWAIETAFNTVLAPVTAWFTIAWETPILWDILNWWFELVPSVVDWVLSGRWRNQVADATGLDSLEWESLISDWYNNELDDQWRADLQNTIFLILAHKYSKSKARLKVNAFVKDLWWATKDAITKGKQAYDFEIFYRKRANWWPVYEETHTLNHRDIDNPDWPNDWGITGWPVIQERWYREWKLTSEDIKAWLQSWAETFLWSLKNEITNPRSKTNQRLEESFNKIDKQVEEKKATDKIKEEEVNLKREVEKQAQVDKQLKDLNSKLKEELWDESEPNAFQKKLSWLSEEKMSEIRSNPFAVDETRRMIEEVDNNPGTNIDEYTIWRYESALDTVIKKIDEINKKRTEDVWPLYDLFEDLQAPIDISWLKTAIKELSKNLPEDMTRGELSNFDELVSKILDWNIETADQLWQIRKLADRYADWDWNWTEWKSQIRALRKEIDNIFRDQIPEFKELDANYIKVLDELRDVRDKIYAKKNWKWGLRENAVSTIKNLLSASNRQYLNRLEKYIPGIKQYIQAIQWLKNTYNAYTKWNYGSFTKGFAWYVLRWALRIGWFIKWWPLWYLEWMAIDTGLEKIVTALSRRAIKNTLTKMNPQARAELERIAEKHRQGKELTKAEKEKLKDLEERIIEKIDNMKKTKAQKEAWNEFKEKVKGDYSKNKLTKKDWVVNDGKTIVTGNDKTIVSDGKWKYNEKRKGAIDETDERTEENKNLWYDTSILSDESYNKLAPRDKAKYRAWRDLKNSQNKLDAWVKVLKNKENLTLGQLQQLGKDVWDLERKQIDYVRRGGEEIKWVRDSLDEAYKILENNWVEVRYLEKWEEFNDLNLYNSFWGWFVGKHYVVDTMSPAIVKVQDGKMHILAKWNVEVSEKPVEAKPVETKPAETTKPVNVEKPKNNITGTKTAVLEKGETETPQNQAQKVIEEAKSVETNKQLPTVKDDKKKKPTSNIKPTLEQDEIKGEMYHVTPEVFDEFKEWDTYNDFDWNTAFGTFVSDDEDFLEDFKTVASDRRRINADWNKKTLNVDLKKPILHPYDLWSLYDQKEAESILIDYLQKVGRFDLDTQKDLIGLKFLDIWWETYENWDYDTYPRKDNYTKEEILNMPGDIYWGIYQTQFEGEDDNNFLFWEYAEEDAKKLQDMWYDGVIFYEWTKNWNPVFSIALPTPNKYLPKEEKNENVSSESKVSSEPTEQKKDTVSKNKFGLTEQKNTSRIGRFTNVINRIIDKYSDDIDKVDWDNYLFIRWEDYIESLEIKESNLGTGNNKIPILKITDVDSMGNDDLSMQFKVNEDWSLTAVWVKIRGQKLYMPISDSDELLHTWAINLENQKLWESTIDEDTGEVRKPKKNEQKQAVSAPTVEEVSKTEEKPVENWNKNPEWVTPVATIEKPQNITGTKTAITQPKKSNNAPASNVLQQIKDKWKDVEMDNFDDEDGEWWGKNTKKFLRFAKELKKAFKILAEENNFELVNYNVWYYDVSAFFKNNNWWEPKYYYVSVWDTRTPGRVDKILYRTAERADYRNHWSNNYTPLEKLPNAIVNKKIEEKPVETESKNPEWVLPVTTTEKPQNIIGTKTAVTNAVRDDSDVTGRFRNLSLEDYQLMQKFQWLEEDFYRGDKEKVIYTMILRDIIEELRKDDIEYNEFEDWFEFDLSHPNAIMARNSFIDEWNFYQKLKEWKATEKELLDHDFVIDNWEEYDEAHPEKFKPDWNEEYMLEYLDDFFIEMFWREKVYDPFVTQAFNLFRDLIKNKEDYAKDFNEKRALLQELVNKYGEYWKPVENTSKNTITTGDRTALTSNNKKDETDISTSKLPVWWENQWKEWERGVQVSELQRTAVTKGWQVQGNDDWKSVGGAWLIWASEWASTNGNGLTTPERRRGLLSVSEQRKINEQSREILEKHNFSTQRSDYSNDELNTLFQYSGNWGVAKAGDENVFGARFQYYTPDLASEALWRWVKKYLWNTKKGLAIDPTAWLWDLLKRAYNEWRDIGWYEIDPVPGTIAKLKFPEWDFRIGKDNGDFQKRFMNFRWEVVYDKPKDWGFNADVILINAPFGQRITNKHDKKIKTLEDYFTKESIQFDSKDENTIIGLLMPSRWLKAGMNPAKEWLAENTTFLEAYRLPAGVFQYTDVGTDLIILKNVKWWTNYFVDDAYFLENPNRVLWVEKERKGRFGMEKYIDWDPSVINTIWRDVEEKVEQPLDTEPTVKQKKEQTTKFTPKNTGTTESENSKSKTKVTEWSKTAVTDKSVAKNKNAVTSKKKKRWNTIETVTVWDKTDIGLYQVNYDEKWIVYSDHTDTNGFVDKEYYDTDKVRRWEEPRLNFIRDVNGNPQAQINTLYFWWDVYAKLDQLEKDYKDGYLEEKQYIKQKEWLRNIIPETVKVADIDWNPFDEALMSKETDLLNSRSRPMTIREAFKKFLEGVPWSYFSWLMCGRDEMIKVLIEWKKIIRKTVSKNSYTSEEAYKTALEEAEAEKQAKIQDIKEWWWALLSQFLQEQLSEEMQKKLEVDYNSKYRAYVTPDFMSMPFSIDNMSSTFNWWPLKVKSVQNEWIAFLTSKSWWSLTFGVGIGKTLTGVASIEKMIQLWRCKRAVIIVPPGTYKDWLNTYHDAFPLREIVYWWWLNAPDIKRLKKDLWEDPKDWIKDGQVLLITYSWLDTLSYKWDTKNEIIKSLRDVMWDEWKKKKKWASEEDKEGEQFEALVDEISKKKRKNKAQTEIDAELSEKYWDTVLEELFNDVENMWKAEFIKHFVEKVKDSPLDEGIKKEDAEKMYNTRPVFIEDLWLDFACVDEVHNFKKSFTKARKTKKGEDDKDSWWVWDQYANLASWKPATIAMQLFVLSQYIAKRFQNWGWLFSLSATPFTNQPVEIYNILSLHAYNRLLEKGIVNMNSFFDLFAKFTTDYMPDKRKFSQVMKWFRNLPELQRLIWEYMLHHWDAPDLVRPEEKIKKIVLSPSPLQVMIDRDLNTEYKNLSGRERKIRWLAIITDIQQNTLSPYITQYAMKRGIFPKDWNEFIKDSPKLEFLLKYNKAFREFGYDDWIYAYVPKWVPFHKMLKEAVEEYSKGLEHATKVWIISWEDASKEVMVDWEKIPKKIMTAKEFRDWIINFLIWWEQTKEWINLQDNWYATIITNLDWNPTDTIQVRGRVVRQWNLKDHVQTLYILLKDWWDIAKFQKHDEKASRLDELWSFKWRKMDLDWISPEEEKFALITDPEVKAEIFIDIEEDRLKRDIQTKTGKLWNIKEAVRTIKDRTPMAEDYKKQMEEQEEKIDKLKEEMKWLPKDSSAYWLLDAELDRRKQAYKNTKKYYDDEMKKINKAEKLLAWYWLDVSSTEDVVKELKEEVDKLVTERDSLKGKKEELIERFKKEKEELDKIAKTPDDYIEELKEDWRNLIRFETREDQKEYLDIRKELKDFKQEVINSRKVTANDKNKLTS